MSVTMAAEQEQNGAMDNGGECKELDKGTENQAAVIEIVMLDSDTTETHVDGGGLGGAAKTGGGASIGSPCSSCSSRPIPPFLLKIYDMLGNNETNSVVSWSSTGTSFVITDPHSFAANVLPIYFRHRNFQSFVTQLNSYGFRKVSWEQWEYRNEYFRKGERHLLRNIKRRNQISPRIQPSSDIEPFLHMTSSSCGSSNMEKELEILMKEQDLLRAEIINLKDKQETLEGKIDSLKNQATSNEKDQTRMIFAAQRILRRQRDLSDNETQQENLKGKRKLDEKSAAADDFGSRGNIPMANIVELMSEHLGRGGKMALDEEEVGKDQSNTFISLEDLIGESSDWVEYIKELQEKASNLKS